MSSVLRRLSQCEAAEVYSGVVLPTRLFWFAIAITRDIINYYAAMSYVARIHADSYTLFHVKRKSVRFT